MELTYANREETLVVLYLYIKDTESLVFWMRTNSWQSMCTVYITCLVFEFMKRIRIRDSNIQIRIELISSPGQRWVQLSVVRNSVKTSCTQSLTALSQAGQRWIELTESRKAFWVRGWVTGTAFFYDCILTLIEEPFFTFFNGAGLIYTY